MWSPAVKPDSNQSFVMKNSHLKNASLFALLMAALTLPSAVKAQVYTDNFNSYADLTALVAVGGWQYVPASAGISVTFPATGDGKGVRIQTPNGSLASIFRTNIYTDFYLAADVVNWNNNFDQAIILEGRATNQAGVVATKDYTMNFDVVQDGDAAGDRKGGQLQIIRVDSVSPLVLVGMAVGNVSLIPGNSYRFIFKGVGTDFTGQIYDLNDLTSPVITLHGSDTNTYTAGVSGIGVFDRDTSTGGANSTDVTYDNYYAGPTDPNIAIAPAIKHPVAGTPQVITRTPTNRFTNFHPFNSGISFTVNTFSANTIDAAATRLYLNGVNVSASLAPLPANGTNASFSTAAGTLKSNTVYSARIELADTTGTLKSTNTFWFDTFSDAYLTNPPVKTVEAEDYNYANGGYQLDPIPISGLDTNGTQVNGSVATGGNDLGYFGMTGTPGVDFSKPGGSYNFVLAEYRSGDRVQITQGSYLTTRDEAADIIDVSNVAPTRIHDTQRARYAVSNVFEYQVRLTSPGDWMNYTRSFVPTNYNVYLRCGSFGSTTVFLDQVTTDPTIARQELVRWGAFNVENHLMRLNYRYAPLMSGSSPAVVSLSGTNTLRLTLGGTVTKDERVLVMDYFLFIPTSDSPTLVTPVYPPTVFDNFNDGNDTNNPAWDHYDPIGGMTAEAATYALTNGGYRLFAPAPLVPDAGPARAGSFLRNVDYSDFYISVDVIDFDDTVRQAFGIGARINTPGLGSTGGYLFSWEPGSGTLPGTNNGDLDISRLVNEAPSQFETGPSGLHLTRGKSYRFVFMGKGFDFEGQVYELPDTFHPLIRLPAHDGLGLYPSGRVGLVVASQSSLTVPGDATFDNFLVTTAEPRLTVDQSGGSVALSWPLMPYRLQSSPSVSSPVWTEVTSGITQPGGQNAYVAPVSGSRKYFRLVYP